MLFHFKHKWELSRDFDGDDLGRMMRIDASQGPTRRCSKCGKVQQSLLSWGTTQWIDTGVSMTTEKWKELHAHCGEPGREP